MADLDNKLQDTEQVLLRELVYGFAQTRKTTWAGKAAESNYNILLVDGDRKWHVLKQIKPEYQKRIQVVDMADELGKPVFALGLARMLKDGKLIWDEKEKRSAKLSPNENCISIDLNAMGHHDILVVDSWTALVTSLMLQYAKENMIDLSNAEEGEDKWGYYRWAGALATWMLTQLSALNCHVIVIAHEDVYEKRSKDGKKIEWSKRQVKSTSGNHAMILPSKFTEVLYFYSKGTATKIDTKGSETGDGGSCILAPGTYNWDDLQFASIIKEAGIALPSEDNPYINYRMDSSKTTHSTNLQGGIVKPVDKPVAKLNVAGSVNKTKLLG